MKGLIPLLYLPFILMSLQPHIRIKFLQVKSRTMYVIHFRPNNGLRNAIPVQIMTYWCSVRYTSPPANVISLSSRQLLRKWPSCLLLHSTLNFRIFHLFIPVHLLIFVTYLWWSDLSKDALFRRHYTFSENMEHSRTSLPLVGSGRKMACGSRGALKHQ